MAAPAFRNFNRELYGLQMPMYDPWTSQRVIIDLVAELFDTTVKLVETPSGQVDKSREQAKQQLPELAALLLVSFSERLQWLSRYVV